MIVDIYLMNTAIAFILIVELDKKRMKA